MAVDPRYLIAGCIVVALIARRLPLLWSTGSHRRLYLVSDDSGNESLVLDASLAGRRALFMLDTAYAGAPVVSETYAAVQGRCAWGSVESRFKKCMRLASHSVSTDDRNVSVDRELLRNFRCRAFTSGCTMRLMGIGETIENQADMLLCPPIVFDGRRDHDPVDADVLVTNPLPGSPHILTMDYLLHRSPCVILPRAGRMHLRLPVSTASLMRPTFEFHDVRLVGGAFCVRFTVGGAHMDLVIDTGASTTASLSSTSLDKLKTCTRDGRSLVQVGVNGERVCSNVITTQIRFGRIDMGVVDVLATTSPVQGSDGYVGMGLLRSLDMWFEHGRMGVRCSGLPVRAIDRARHSVCASGALPSACAA